MGRIRQHIEVGANKYWTLFDTGGRNTYVNETVAKNLEVLMLPEEKPVSLVRKGS